MIQSLPFVSLILGQKASIYLPSDTQDLSWSLTNEDVIQRPDTVDYGSNNKCQERSALAKK